MALDVSYALYDATRQIPRSDIGLGHIYAFGVWVNLFYFHLPSQYAHEDYASVKYIALQIETARMKVPFNELVDR